MRLEYSSIIPVSVSRRVIKFSGDKTTFNANDYPRKKILGRKHSEID